ncbi:hypothetical protein [Martelella sp. HB161492]|uniref:hypothetical protein n=1 Tax=Martelella sp. HB161492 TaxID=2720726 RepID=UPI001591815E|nr:hypothetical protein [Martelella sp. HB161492]
MVMSAIFWGCAGRRITANCAAVNCSAGNAGGVSGLYEAEKQKGSRFSRKPF